METVENKRYTGLVKIGIGSDEHTRALFAAGCERVYKPEELVQGPHDDRDPAYEIFRAGDIAVLVHPGIITSKLMAHINAGGISWQVVGHDPITIAGDEQQKAFRKSKPRGAVGVAVPEATGRPPKWPIPTTEQLAVILGWWQSDRKRGLVISDTRKLMGVDVPDYWVRDQVIKSTGSAKRTPGKKGVLDGGV